MSAPSSTRTPGTSRTSALTPRADRSDWSASSSASRRWVRSPFPFSEWARAATPKHSLRGPSGRISPSRSRRCSGPSSTSSRARSSLRRAMIARGRYTIQPLNTPTDFLFVYTCDGSHLCSAMRVHQPQGGFVLRGPGQLRQARRTRPVGGNERLVFLSQSFVDNADEFGYLGDLLVWDPGLARALFVGAPIRPGAHSLGSATGAAALVSFDVFATGEYGTTLFRLDPAQASTRFPNVDLTEAYTLLEPSYLYNTDDLRFHRAQPSLDATALPATLEGAIFAAAALRIIGSPPLLLDLEAVQDTDHVLAVFRLRGRWGAIAKSNFSGLRYREPVYRTLRELGMSYFEGYVNLRGDRTLRAFSRPVSLARFDRTHAGWMTSADDLWFIPTHLVGIPHTRLLTRAIERRLSRVDRRSLAAGLVGYREH